MRRSANSIVHNIAEGKPKAKAEAKAEAKAKLVSYELKFIKSRSEVDELIVHCRDTIDELNSLNKTLEGRSKPKP